MSAVAENAHQVNGLTLYQRNGQASLFLSAQKKDDRGEIALADLLIVTVQVEGSPSLEVRWPDILNTKTWRLREKLEPKETQIAENKLRWQQTVKLAPLLPAENDLLLLPVYYRENDGQWRKASWTPIAIYVETQIIEPKLENARGITDIERLPTTSSSWPLFLWLTTGALAFVAIVSLLWCVGKRRRKIVKPLTADEWAARELDRLDRMRLPEKKKGAPYVTLVSNVIRAYFEKRFALAARRQTSQEFLHTIADSRELREEQRELLHDFLGRCDQVKFAGSEPTETDCQALRECARRIVALSAAPEKVSGEPTA